MRDFIKNGGDRMSYYVVNGVVYFSREAANAAKQGK